MDILSELNPAQRAAVESIEGPQLVIAGPGSGKTRVITSRIAYLIKTCGVSPYSIIAVTFTNKAAREMSERVYDMINLQADGLTLGTFHSICARILRKEADSIGLDRRFIIYDDGDQLSLIGRCLEELSLNPKQYSPRAIKSAISQAKARLLNPTEYVSQDYFEEVVKRVYERYQGMLIESKALDFDDLLMQAVCLFRDHNDVLSKYQSRYLHVMIDEFQDTSLAQYTLAKQLAGKHRNICVVGDPDQSIYSWRFANLRHILDFERDYQDAKVVFLEQNYRSSQTILEAASHLIAVNKQRKDKNLWTHNDGGAPISILETFNEQEEAQFVVSEIDKLMTDHKHSFGDCAVMYRTNAQSRVLEEAFVRYGVPYKLVGATRFYERREIKDVLSYLRLINNPYDSVRLGRIINVPGRGIGQRTMADLSAWAQGKGVPLYAALELIAQGEETTLNLRCVQALTRFSTMLGELLEESEHRDLLGLFDFTLEHTGYKNYVLEGNEAEERWANILELRGLANDYNDLQARDGLAAMLERVSLVSDVDNLEEKVDAVTLITLHQAKGLEFTIVFIVGMDDGVLPHFRSFATADQMEEERRLCYVGITRAKEKLYLIHAFRRSLGGGSRTNPPSSFLQDIPSHLVDRRSNQQTAKRKSGNDDGPKSQVGVFEAGDKVAHSRFGEGIVVSCINTKDDYEITVAFGRGEGIKKLLLSLARLEKIS